VKLSPDVIVVTRPTKWGNPHPLDLGRAEAIRRYREDLLAGRLAISVDDVKRELRGRDLACYCPLDEQCHADVLLASVLPRAIETASIIAPGLGLDTFGRECDLCEVHTGEADGLEWTEYATRYGSFDMEAEPDRVFAPLGESLNSFHQRVRGMLQRVAGEYEGQTVVAVCHAGVIMASVRLLLGVSGLETGAQLRPSNTGLTEWEYDPSLERWTLHSFNEATHLLGMSGDHT
jgi:probable phosphoglycerate mutase